MQSQFTKEFINDIYLFYDDNIIIIRKSRRVKKLFNVFVKHTLLLSLIIFLIKVILFSNRKKKIINMFYFNIVYFSFIVDIEIMQTSLF